MKRAMRQKGVTNDALCWKTYVNMNMIIKEPILDSIDMNLREAVKEVETIVPYAQLDKGR